MTTLRRYAFAGVMAALSLAAALSLVACSPAPEGPTDSEPQSEAPAQPLEPMSPEDKRAGIAANFPIEIPVPNGEIVRGEAQGEDAWDYEIVVLSTPKLVADWYAIAYRGANWEVVGQETSPEGATVLTLRKGGAESRITVVEDDSGNARATVIVGVGAPVLDTQ